MNENGKRRQWPQRQRLPARQNGGIRHRQNGSAGSAHRSYERYVALAKEAAVNGDTVEAENFYQHAEHYFRIMRERAT